MAKVYVKFPKAGLGNLMLVWAKGFVFAKINDLELITSSWWGIRWGPIFRREKKKRFYRNYFRETPLAKRVFFNFFIKKKTVCHEPLISKISDEEKRSNMVFLFDNPTTGEEELFGALRDYRDLIRQEIWSMLMPGQKWKLNKGTAPVISVHIRRGDFKIGNPITPLSHFISVIHIIRKEYGKNLPVTIFSDAEDAELTEILKMEEVSKAKGESDIVDLLLMSRSNIIVLSQSSSFSYWAAFLSDALVIMSPTDWQYQIKESGEKYTEFKWNANDPQSTQQLEQLVRKIDFEK